MEIQGFTQFERLLRKCQLDFISRNAGIDLSHSLPDSVDDVILACCRTGVVVGACRGEGTGREGACRSSRTFPALVTNLLEVSQRRAGCAEGDVGMRCRIATRWFELLHTVLGGAVTTDCNDGRALGTAVAV